MTLPATASARELQSDDATPEPLRVHYGVPDTSGDGSAPPEFVSVTLENVAMSYATCVMMSVAESAVKVVELMQV